MICKDVKEILNAVDNGVGRVMVTVEDSYNTYVTVDFTMELRYRDAIHNRINRCVGMSIDDFLNNLQGDEDFCSMHEIVFFEPTCVCTGDLEDLQYELAEDCKCLCLQTEGRRVYITNVDICKEVNTFLTDPSVDTVDCLIAMFQDYTRGAVFEEIVE